MTMTVSRAACLRAVMVTSLCAAAGWVSADTRALILQATTVGVEGPAETLRIEVLRWSTDEERKPILTAASAPPPAPPAPAAAAPAAGRAGRGGRGGRGGREGEPPSPLARLTAAVKAAPTVGFIWGQGVTGYSIKYAWRASQPDGGERIVLVTDRRLGAHSPSWPTAAPTPSGRAGSGPPAAAPAPAEFTVLEMRIDGKGRGEGKMSLTSTPIVDATAQTVAVDGYAAMPPLLKVER
jgi:hypothetical protein